MGAFWENWRWQCGTCGKPHPRAGCIQRIFRLETFLCECTSHRQENGPPVPMTQEETWIRSWRLLNSIKGVQQIPELARCERWPVTTRKKLERHLGNLGGPTGGMLVPDHNKLKFNLFVIHTCVIVFIPYKEFWLNEVVLVHSEVSSRAWNISFLEVITHAGVINHCDIRSVWESLLVQCIAVCVAVVQTGVLYLFVSSTEVLIFNAKCI